MGTNRTTNWTCKAFCLKERKWWTIFCLVLHFALAKIDAPLTPSCCPFHLSTWFCHHLLFFLHLHHLQRQLAWLPEGQEEEEEEMMAGPGREWTFMHLQKLFVILYNKDFDLTSQNSISTKYHVLRAPFYLIYSIYFAVKKINHSNSWGDPHIWSLAGSDKG